MKKFILKSAFLFFLVLPQLEAIQSPTLNKDITFYTENYPPANYLANDQLRGISVDTLKAIWKHLKVAEQDILVVPWSRGYRFTLDKSNTALFTMSQTPPRESLFKWVGPIFNSTHVLMAKKSKKFNFSNLGQIFYHKIATVEGDVSEISLHEVGFPSSNMAKVSEIKQAFLMMQSDRVDMIVVSIHGFAYLAKQLDFDVSDYEQVWQVNKIGNYFAFNINTSDEVIQKYQNAFDDIAKQRLTIKEFYELPQAEY
jgi:polar amino acid transport system substrate-binding protein